MQTVTELNTVYVVTNSNTFRLWYNEAGGYWQADIAQGKDTGLRLNSPHPWLYFACGNTLTEALAKIGGAL